MVNTNKPQFPQAPRIPRIGRKTGPTPLKGPAVPLPADAEEDKQARWQQFRSFTAASFPEFICYEWLTKKKKLKPQSDFFFQAPVFGGRTQFGGFILDFYFPDKRMAWFIQGLQYHYVKTKDRARDVLARAAIAARGLLVVEIFEDDLLQREEFTLSRAFRGEQVSQRGRI